MPEHDSYKMLREVENQTDEEIKEVAKRYPFYGLAQFRLLAHYKKKNNVNFQKQASKTALFYHNNRWLHHQLNNSNKIIDNNLISLESNRLVLENNQLESPDLPEKTLAKTTPIPQATDFEPLYTVDYFASQGIKLSDEIITSDKLGTQLKSFTEWLKSMKKVHPQVSPGTDEQTDKMIRYIAETSNTDSDVITEAMAEVLVKQHKNEQAIEMYNKLSLNNPSKSAYFAAKIQSLKIP